MKYTIENDIEKEIERDIEKDKHCIIKKSNRRTKIKNDSDVEENPIEEQVNTTQNDKTNNESVKDSQKLLITSIFVNNSATCKTDEQDTKQQIMHFQEDVHDQQPLEQQLQEQQPYEQYTQDYQSQLQLQSYSARRNQQNEVTEKIKEIEKQERQQFLQKQLIKQQTQRYLKQNYSLLVRPNLEIPMYYMPQFNQLLIDAEDIHAEKILNNLEPIQVRNYYMVFRFICLYKVKEFSFKNSYASQILKSICLIEFSNLKKLNLYNNKISNISSLCLLNAPSLQSLELSGNQIVQYRSISKCNNINKIQFVIYNGRYPQDDSGCKINTLRQGIFTYVKYQNIQRWSFQKIKLTIEPFIKSRSAAQKLVLQSKYKHYYPNGNAIIRCRQFQ